ncbi:MAG: prepilin peptidase [Deltaproteobacteria bacterium]|nr:prepilin peptidase [Deltaproteobacteria bacterium]
MFGLIFVDALCLAICLIAAVIDVRSYRIPNWLTGWGALALLVAQLAFAALQGGGAGLVLAAGHSGLGLLVGGGLFAMLAALRFIGWGDVKLMATVGVGLGFPLIVLALVYVCLTGGIVALSISLWRGQLSHVFRNIYARGRQLVKQSKGQIEMHRIPYGLAILLGTAWAVLSRYFPQLRLP